MIHAFHIANGRVSYRNRWVRTPKWEAEHAAHKALFGSWGNPPTTDPSVLGKDGGVANTNIVWHAGKLFALEEAHRPFALDPADAGGAGLLGFCWRVQGRALHRASQNRSRNRRNDFLRLFRRRRLLADARLRRHRPAPASSPATINSTRPYASMVHDFMVTRNYVLFPVLPLTGSMQRAMAGKPAYAWEADKRSYVGVMKRNAEVSSIRWFECDPCYVFHPMNAYEDGDKIVGDVMQYEAAPLFPDSDGRPGDPAKAVARLTRWTFDLAANTNTFKQDWIDDLAGEFPRFDERFAGLHYRHGFFAASSDRSDRTDGFDTLAHIDLKTRTRSVYQLPRGDAVSEPIFVPRSADAPEGDGYLLATIYRGAEHRSDLAVFDATALENGPVAVAELSHRVPFGFHGNWRPAA